MRKIYVFIMLVGLLVIISHSLRAAGLGIAFRYGVGSVDYDLYDGDASHFGINFVFDSNVAKNSVFNYRLNAGVEFFEHSYDATYDYGYLYTETEYNEGIRIITDHTFGFGIVKSRVVRLWLGPNIRFGFVSADEAGLCVGAGLTALGLNFNFGPVFTLGVEAGYQFYADLYFDDVVSNEYVEDYYLYEGSSSGANNMFVLKISILFRIHDTYDDFF